MKGVGGSGGVCGGACKGSSFSPLDERRLLSVDALGSDGLGADAVAGLSSTTSLLSLKLFFDLNTSRKRPVDEDRLTRS